MLKIPSRFKYLEELMTEKKMGIIAHLLKRNAHIYRVAVATEAPNIAGIYLLNGMDHEYETIRRYSDKKYEKRFTTSGLFSFITLADMGLDLATTFWKDRNMATSAPFYKELLDVDDKYLDMLMSTDKFYKNLEIDLYSDHMYVEIKKLDKLFEMGWNNKKFIKLAPKIYKEYGYEEFLPQDAKEIFLF